ncbi:MAG: corrinoid protein [Deltaproteobacteria bacterium]|nr:corrinoid protein [Deltaproteobacteria bacterium]MBW2306759.1 corrinoid protein [Deltaproteobacteria bacterium]
MATEERTGELLKQIHDAVVAYDGETCAQLCKAVLEEGIDPYQAVIKGLAAGMDTVGGLYEKKEYFVPELLLCSDALYAGMDILRPHVKMGQDTRAVGKILMGVIEGDIHDIGKNLVKAMFEAAGWEIYDLDKDVKLQRFVEEQQRTNAEVVAISALMTTSMLAMPKVIEMLKAQNPDVIIMVGGAPLTQEIAQKYGADGYAPDAVSAVHEANRLLAKAI